MKTIKHITRIQEEKLSEAGRHRLQLAKKHLRDAVRICKLRYPELLLPLETIQFIPVKESIRLSTDGLHIFYDPEFVIHSSAPAGEGGIRDAEAEPTVSEFLLHILFHGLLVGKAVVGVQYRYKLNHIVFTKTEGIFQGNNLVFRSVKNHKLVCPGNKISFPDIVFLELFP